MVPCVYILLFKTQDQNNVYFQHDLFIFIDCFQQKVTWESRVHTYTSTDTPNSILFHTFLIPINVKFHTKICIWYTYCKHSALTRVTKWKYINIPGSFGEYLRFYYSISINFSKKFPTNCMKNKLAYKSLAPTKNLHKTLEIPYLSIPQFQISYYSWP